MLASCDKLAMYLERGKGLFSVESAEASDRYLRKLDGEVKRYGINAMYVPDRLKFLCKKFFRRRTR